jgi:hypothetical protein
LTHGSADQEWGESVQRLIFYSLLFHCREQCSLEWKPIGRRIRGRPRKRQIEDAEEDIQRLGIRGWKKLCKERMEWKRINEKAKTHSGL